MVNIHIYYEATDTLEAYFSRFGPKTDFNFSKCQGPEELGKFSYLGQIDLTIAYK